MPPPGFVTCQPLNSTTEAADEVGKDDLNALLYIVVTLLFYSMGIIIGIITYLKREQAEMEEDKMFDMYMQLKREPFNIHKKEQVNQMALYLKQLEEKQAAREKIDSWKIMDAHQLQLQLQQHSPSCRYQTNLSTQHSPCLCCNKAMPPPEMRRSFHGGLPLAISETDWAEHKGGTAFLCSLTLDVCEPLLTSESGKRVVFPDFIRTAGGAYNGFRPVLAAPKDPCGDSFKSAFRHSFPAVDYTSCAPLFARGELNDNDFINETGQQLQNSDDHPEMFNKFDIELQDMRQISFDEVKAVFQNESPIEEVVADVYDLPILLTAPATLSRANRTLSLTVQPERSNRLKRQLSYDPERTYTGLTVHSTCCLSPHADEVDNSVPKQGESQLVEEGVLPFIESQEYATCNEISVSPGDFDKTGVETCDELRKYLTQQQHQYPLELQEEHIDYDLQGNNQESLQKIPTPLAPPDSAVPSSPVTPAPFCASPSKSPIPLQSPQTANQDVHEQIAIHQESDNAEQFQPSSTPLPPQPQQHTLADVRPKVFPVPNIPKFPSSHNSPDAWASSSDYTLPKSRKRHQSELYQSWKKGNSQSLDIPSIADHHGKVRANDKKPSRIQPERRGALFFTQKSLHLKDFDSPKFVSNRKQFRSPGIFSRQESVDSFNSRSSEQSESLDSPLLQQGNENCPVMTSPSSSPGSSTMSPPTASKHQRRIPRLARSHTVDTSKLLHK